VLLQEFITRWTHPDPKVVSVTLWTTHLSNFSDKSRGQNEAVVGVDAEGVITEDDLLSANLKVMETVALEMRILLLPGLRKIVLGRVNKDTACRKIL